jgi:CRP-like cAMP-binding protein
MGATLKGPEELESFAKSTQGGLDMEGLQRILAEHPFFSGMEERLLQILAGCASNVRFEEGKVILREGEEADKFYLIRDGRVALQVFSDRRGPLTISTLQGGDILGWSWLTPPYRFKFTARTMETTRVISLDGKCLREKSENDNQLGYELLKRFVHIIDDRLQATRLQLLNVYED